MADPWTFSGESAPLGQIGGGTVTLVQGSSFAISSSSGDMRPGRPHGLFFRDTRFLSRLELTINGEPPEALAASTTDPFSAMFAARSKARASAVDTTLMVFRNRYVGRGMREDIIIRNFGAEATFCAIEIIVESDFADLFEVKEGRIAGGGDYTHAIFEATPTAPAAIVLGHSRRGVHRGARLSFCGQAPTTRGNHASFEVIVPAGGSWSVCVQVTPIIEGEEIEPRYLCGEPVDRATPSERLSKWRRDIPIVETEHDALHDVVHRGADDLGALRIFDPDFPERAVVAAGAPWFMTLFGRDSLLTAWMGLMVDPDLALGVLQTLARFQGKDVDPRNEEEPGRILHEMRFGDATSSLSLGGGRVYYGSADSTPLFVMLLGELRRWGLAREAVDHLLPHADRALDWIAEFGDRDGDGYVEYARASDRGLINQGWKDSWDGIRFASGEPARAPIALAEVQAYTYSAYLARAHFAWEAQDAEVARTYEERASALKQAFNRDFWLEDRGFFAVGLDGDKRPIDSLTSNIGHCLWTGIVDEDKAARVAAHLLSDPMFSGWGVRTLASDSGGYNPLSYHCGSVWPHDNAIVAAGLMRYGFVAEAQKIILAMLDAGMSQGARLPELFSGMARSDFPTVVAYPTSCSPQAWAAASGLLFLRTLLRFDPWVPHGRVWLDPVIPEEIGRLHVHRIPLAGQRISVRIENGTCEVEGMPDDLQVVRRPRDPITAGVEGA